MIIIYSDIHNENTYQYVTIILLLKLQTMHNNEIEF